MSDVTQGAVLIIDNRQAMRARLSDIVRQAGFEPIPAQGGREAYPLAVKHRPLLTLLSDTIRDVHCEPMIKAFKLGAQTRDIPIYIVTDSALVKTVNVYQQAGAAGCLPQGFGKKELREKVRLHHPDAKTAQTVKITAESPARPDGADARDAEEKIAAPATENVQKSCLARERLCPLHGKIPKTFSILTLRPGTQIIEQDWFDMPVYKEPARGYEYCDFSLQEVVICPFCFFATVHPAFFPASDEPSAKPTLPVRVAERLLAGAPDREKILDRDNGALYQGARTSEQALLSYELALVSGQALYDCDPSLFAVELYRSAHCRLRRARILAGLGRGEEENAELAAAFESLKKGYGEVTGPHFWRLSYQLIAVGIYLGRDADIGGYLGKLLEANRSAHALPAEERDTQRKYFNMIQKTWEDREYRRRKSRG